VNHDLVRRQMGMVFQEFNLFNHLTVLGNVTIGMTKVLGIPAKDAEKKAMKELERVGMADHHAANIPPSCPGARSSGWALPGPWHGSQGDAV
jgi:ABC-type polar amino acid transport system ATPase subunit